MTSSKIRTWRALADKATAEHRAAKARLKAARGAVVDADDEFVAADEAQQIVQTLAETIQQEAHNRIAGVVSRCLAAVFDEPYDFRITFEQARGRTEARLEFVRGGEAMRPIDASGGGVVDVAAFALRLSCLMLARPASRRTVVLDEPFKFVSADRRHRVRQMLEGLCEDLRVQFIMVTHIEELQCGKVVEVY